MSSTTDPIAQRSSLESNASLEAGAPAGRDTRSFAFGPFVLNPERQLLAKSGRPVRIGGRALDILTVLVERSGQLVDRQTIVSRAWPTTFVDASNLKVNVSGLRRILEERADAPRYIATVAGRGYRFIASVRILEPSGHSPESNLAVRGRVIGLIETIDDIRHGLAEAWFAPADGDDQLIAELCDHAGSLRKALRPSAL